MKFIGCPHCGHRHGTTAAVPNDVVVVLPCPSCSEWIILYRNRVIALNRQIIEHGSRDEKIAHFAEIISEFLEGGGFPLFQAWTGRIQGGGASKKSKLEEKAVARSQGPITQSEMERFVRLELHKIDQADYFKKHFG